MSAAASSVDWRQLGALVRVWLRKDMHLAGGRGAGMAGVFILSSLFMLLGALGAAAMVFAGVPRFAFTTLGLLFGSMPTAMALITDFGVAAVDISDQDVVGHRPVSDRTYLLARLLTVGFYGLAVGIPAQLPYALAGLMAAGSSDLYPLAYLPIATLVIAATTSAVVVVYASIARLFGPRRLANLVLLVQLFSIGLFFLGGPMIAPTTALLARLDLESPGLMLALPYAWAAGCVELLLGHFSHVSAALAALFLALVGALCWVLPGRLSLGYVDALSRQLANAAGEQPPRPARSGLPPLMVAGYELARAALRDPQTRLRVIPSLVLPVLYAAFTLLLQRPNSPLIDTGLLNLLTALFPAALLAVGPSAFLIGAEFSNAWRASWIFGAAPLTRPGLVHRGVRLAAFRAFLPGFFVYVIIASLLWPVGHTLVVAFDVLCSGLLSMGLASFAVHAFPSSRPLQAGVNFRTQLLMFAALLVPTGAMIALWLIVGKSVSAHLLADAVLLALALPIHALSEWRFDRAARAGRPLLAVDPESAFAAARLRASWWALGAVALASFAVLLLAGTGWALWTFSGKQGTSGLRAWTALRAAEVALDGGKLDRAVKLAEAGLVRRPDDPAALSVLGRAQLRQGHIEEALRTFERRRELAPEGGGSHFYVGEASRLLGRCDEALAAFEAELANPKGGYGGPAQIAKAQALEGCGHAEDSVDAYREYLEVRPDDVEAWEELATLLRKLARDEAATDALESAGRARRLRERSLLPPMPRYW